MLLIFVLFFLHTVAFSAVTTIPFSVRLFIVCTVIFKKSWVFFAAFGLGLFLDLYLLRPLGQTGLMFAIFIFTLFLYERKFETQNGIFVFIATFLGGLFYLWILGYNSTLLQSFVNAVIGVLLFKFLVSNFKFKMNS